MEKKNFKLKRFLSTTLAFLIAAGAFGGVKLSQLPASAEATSAASSDRAYYSFEDGKQEYLDIAAQYNTYEADISITEEENGNNYLRIKYQTWTNLLVNFPFVLEGGKTYSISYRIKPDSEDGLTNQVREKDKYAGIYTGKSTGVTELKPDPDKTNTNRGKAADYMGTRLASFTGLDGDYQNVSWTDWKTVTTTFTVPESAVTEDFKYLALSYFDTSTSNQYRTICVDDIYVKETSTEYATYNFEYEKEYLDFGAEYNQKTAEVSIATETETENKYLQITATPWGVMWVNFPFELQNNTTYKLTYKIKNIEGSTALSSATGVYAGKATGKTSYTTGDFPGLGDHSKVTTDYLSSQVLAFDTNVADEWTEVSTTFTVGDGIVDTDKKQLAFLIRSTDKANKTIGLDDIHIEKATETIDLVASEGHFIPYGSVYTYDADTGYTWYKKDEDGTFKNVPADVSYQEFEIPENGITTFGASEDTTTGNPQFGTYALDVNGKTCGTMSIIGDWDGFVNYYCSDNSRTVAQLVASVSAYYDANITTDYTHVILKWSDGTNENTLKIYKKNQVNWMWKDGTNLQYALRVNGLNDGDICTAVGYAVNADGEVTFSETVKTAVKTAVKTEG